ncbi:protein of unknown function DUF86 [Geotalea uraniireducens Rf4]|uniref:Antitoxin n=2 Tax=Geotalea uraniireducens TaxID=351604 RepID=A5G6E5_GEOUR|nr:protein of unknown function DUF86 [Geotalea uraniireducens Rf4]
MLYMYDRELLLEDFKNIIWALDQIFKRFQAIQSSDDFLKDDIGLEKLDSICMQLINIGEVLKQVDKLTDSKLLVNYPEIDWKKAKGMRDIITHHYFDIDAETIYVVCSEHVPEMKKVIARILIDQGA